MDRTEKLKEAQGEARRVARAYYEMSMTPHGQIILADLRDKLWRSPLKKDSNGAVDPAGTQVAVGEQSFWFYFQGMIDAGANVPMPMKEVSSG